MMAEAQAEQGAISKAQQLYCGAVVRLAAST